MSVSQEQPGTEGGEGGNAVTPSPITADAIKTAGIPDTYLKDGNYDFASVAKDLGELSAMRTSQAERAKLIPQDGKYSFDLPKEFKAPENAPKGYTWSVSEAKVKAFAPLAKELGLTQAQVSQVVTKWAEADFAEVSESVAKNEKFFTDEMGKLGANAKDRLATLHTSLKGAVGEQGAAEIADALTTAAGVQALEKLISLAGGPKLAEKAANSGDAKPDFAKMTARQRLDYANSQTAKH